MTLAASFFQIRWTGVQQNVALPGCGFSFVDNLGRARSRGMELEAELRGVGGLRLSAGVGYVDARFRRTLLSGPQADGSARAVLVRRGDRVPFTPRWTLNAGGEYRVGLHASASAFARAEIQYLGSYRRTLPAPAISYDPSVFAGEARLDGIVSAGLETRAWTISAFVENPTNDRSVVFSNADLVPATRSPLRQATARPRSLGLAASLKY